MTRISLLVLFVLGLSVQIMAQTESTYHVFPVIADGQFSDGSFYRSTFMISNSSATVSPTCNIQLNGLAVDLTDEFNRRVPPDTFFTLNLGASAWYLAETSGTQTFASGYAALSCSAPVAAHALYSFYDRFGNKVGEGTVFSALRGSLVQLLDDQRRGAHLGLAITNDNDFSVTYSVNALDVNGQLVGSTSINVGPRSTRLNFVDELVSIPSNYIGQVLVGSSSGQSVYVTGLRFSGPVFTTIPATVRAR
jgi:hypothetical protein